MTNKEESKETDDKGEKEKLRITKKGRINKAREIIKGKYAYGFDMEDMTECI